MKFTIEVEDFWLEEEALTSALQAHVKQAVVREISENIKDKVEKQITEKVKAVIDTKIALIIDTVLTDLVATGVIVKSGKERLIVDYVKDIFQSNCGWNSPSDQIARIAKEFGKELKVQYNAAFANQIVVNMKEQGLLRDDVVQILLGGKTQA